MTLRQRITLALVVITAVLITPAALGLFALRELEQVARDLRTRDAIGALTLGRLQTAFGEVEHWERIYLALATRPAEERADARAQVQANLARVDTELSRLAESGYREATAPARQRWQQLRQAILHEQQLIEAGDVEGADRYHARVLNTAFNAMTGTLDPIGLAINRGGEEQVERAQRVAEGAVTMTLLALAMALALALVVASWLTRGLLRPIHELRRGMAVVAAGDFQPEVRIPPERPDELGDLARSFDRMTGQLRELDRLKAEFVSIASHELKTPLSVIRGYVSLLIDDVYGPVPEAQQKILASVSEQTDRLTRLVQRLLDVSRFEAGGGRLELRPIVLHDFFRELATSFEVLAYQNEIDFRVQTCPDLPESLVGDPDRLNEVLGNILSNAFKFTPRGGQILLDVQRDDAGIAVEVRDTGVGIPPDKLPKIFEKFFQVENQAQPRSVGSGLGLAIARELVEAHGGTITAESQMGRGTSFRVSLPLEPPVHPA